MPASSTTKKGIDLVYLTSQLVPTGLLLAFIVGSLLFTGGRVTPDEGTKWDEVWRWPVFPVAAWVTIVPAAMAALVVVPVAVAMVRTDDTTLVNRWGQTVPALGGAALFDHVFPAASGPTLVWSHAFAVVLSGFSLSVLTVSMLVLVARDRRSRRGRDDDPEALVSVARLVAGTLMTVVCLGVLVVFAWGSIQAWWSITPGAIEREPTRPGDDPPSVSGAILLSFLATAWLIVTIGITRLVVRQLSARGRSRATTT